MKVSLFKGLDEQGTMDLKGSFLSALLFRKAIVKVLTNKINDQRIKSRKEKFILEGNYAQKMAWAMGYEQAQEEFIAFMKDNDKK